MGWFSDPLLSYLRSYGYNAVLLPKTNVKPLQMLYKSSRKYLDRLGDLNTVFKSGTTIPLPKIHENNTVNNITGRQTGYFKIGLGLSILGNIINAMGGSIGGLDVVYGKAKNIAFEFSNVLEDSIDIAMLDQYLADSDVNPFSHHVNQLLDAEEVYVITKTIKSSEFKVNAKTSDNLDVSLDVPALQQAVGANVKVSVQSDNISKVSFKGNSQLVFGFQAIQLFYDRGQYKKFKPVDSSKGMRDLENLKQGDGEFLMTNSPFLSINGLANR